MVLQEMRKPRKNRGFVALSGALNVVLFGSSTTLFVFFPSLQAAGFPVLRPVGQVGFLAACHARRRLIDFVSDQVGLRLVPRPRRYLSVAPFGVLLDQEKGSGKTFRANQRRPLHRRVGAGRVGLLSSARGQENLRLHFGGEFVYVWQS